MAHALVDQHVNFVRLFEGAQGDTDRLLALGAVVEGDANLTAFAYARSACNPDGILHATPRELDDLFQLWWGFRPTPSAIAKLSAAEQTPAVKAHAGTRFAAAVARQGGWAQLESVYDHPPLSTEHVLHPEKYLEGRDPPWQVKLPELTTLREWDLLADDVMGELRVRLLLDDYGDQRGVGRGWGGDAFRLYGSERGTTGVVWVSRWDTETDAVEFADAFESMRSARSDWIGLPMANPERPTITRNANVVTILDGFEDGKAEGLLVELRHTVHSVKPRERGGSSPELIRVKNKRTRRAQLDLMAIGARDCRVNVEGEPVGYAPVVRAKVPRGWCSVEVRCGDGRSYSAAHRFTRGRNILVIRHEDWD
jgi:hypothetical protein